MDAISLLTRDHRTVDDLFERFEQSDDASERRKLVDTMIVELSVHAFIEEQELYPVMRRVFDEEELVTEAEHEHAEAKALLAVLARLAPQDERFDSMVTELIADVRHHVEEEEGQLFPKLRDKVSDQELDEVGQRLEQARQQAPSKPSADELKVLTQEELYEFAQVIDLDGRSDMNKEELAAGLAGS